MRFIQINKKAILLTLLLLIPVRMIYFINKSTFNSIFHIDYSDFVYIVYLLLFVYVLFRFGIIDIQKYYFSSNMLTIFPLVVIASIMPKILFGQSVNNGFWAQRMFFMLICYYFIFRTLIIEKVVTAECLWKYIYNISFLVTGIIIIQHSIYNYVQILDVGYGYRFGVRITANSTYSTILLIGSLALFFSAANMREKTKSFLGLGMAYYHCILVSQTRIVMVAYVLLTISITLLYNYSTSKKVIFFIIICTGVILVMQTELGQYFVSAVMNSSTDPSAQIREIGKAHYVSEISKTPLVGRGYPQAGSVLAYEAAGLYDRIALNDNGVYGFAYIYGFIGVVWYIWLSIKMFICSFKAVKKGDYRFLLYTFYLQIICVNLIFWYWTYAESIVFAIMLAMMEEYYKNYTEPKVKIYI